MNHVLLSDLRPFPLELRSIFYIFRNWNEETIANGSKRNI